MRRPEESNPRTRDTLGMILGALTMGIGLAPSRAWSLLILAAVVLLYLAGELPAIRRTGSLQGGLRTPAILFSLAVLSILLGLSPLVPGARHPLWALVGGQGGAALDIDADSLGLLQLLGLVFAFLAALRCGAAARTARSLPLTVMVSASALGIVVLILKIVGPVLGGSLDACPLLGDPGVRGAVFGVTLILAVDGLIRSWRDERTVGTGRPVWRRLGAKPLPVFAALICALCLAFASPPAAVVIVAVMGVLLLAWTGLMGGGDSKVPRRILIGLAPGAAILAAIIAVLILGRLSETGASIQARAAHWSAFWASPWFGYGLGMQSVVAKLFMTRANLEAMAAFPAPPESYIAWLEQGGLLVTAPLLACIAWITGAILFALLKARRLVGMMRAIVCASLYLMLYGLVSAAPSELAVAALWMVLLGLGSGAASLSR